MTLASLCLHTPHARGQVRRSSAFTEIKWDSYTYKFFPGNQMGQVLDADGHILGTILSQGGGLQVLPTVSGDAANKLKKSFQAWKDQGGEKALSGGAAPAQPGRASAPIAPSSSVTTRAAVAPTANASDAPANRGTMNRAASPSSAAENAAASIVVAGARLGTLSNPQTTEILRTNLTTLLDMQLLRLQPSLLDDPQMLKYFVLVNNCTYTADHTNDTQVWRLMKNELDYPQAADYYKSHATEILAGVPRNTVATIDSAQLGEFDTGKKAFPLVVMRGSNAKPREVKLQHREIMNATDAINAGNGGSRSCSDAVVQRQLLEGKGQLPKVYALDVEREMTFSQVPMEMDTARKFIESAPANRQVRFDGVFEFLDDPKPASSQPCGGNVYLKCIAFATTVKTITAVKPGSSPMIGKVAPDQALAVVYP